MKILITLATLVSFSSFAQECPNLAGKFNQCTTADKEWDEAIAGIPKTLTIQQSKTNGVDTFNIRMDKKAENASIVYGKIIVGQETKRNIPLDREDKNNNLEFQLSLKSKCEKNKLKIDFKFTDVISTDNSLSKEERKIIFDYSKNDMPNSVSKFSIKGDTLTLVDSTLPLPVKCKRVK